LLFELFSKPVKPDCDGARWAGSVNNAADLSDEESGDRSIRGKCMRVAQDNRPTTSSRLLKESFQWQN
jgi:hypothetical protein